MQVVIQVGTKQLDRRQQLQSEQERGGKEIQEGIA